ncbi:hypothetical protein [Sediminibacterium sp.]|uniref:hypothetical protein n=1 Tax=Sediminibacterium sp. TaxID=1917865 RepID=UPI003F6A3866
MKRNIFQICLFLVISFSVNAQQNNTYQDAGSSVQYQYITTYDLAKLNKILNAELNEFLNGSSMPFENFKGKFTAPKYPVKLYRVKYNSVVPELNNQPTLASGLVAIPETGKDSMPIVSYQHGTVFGKTEVPSFPDESMETKLMIAVFASQGYIVTGADYFGLGISTMPNSYLVKESSEQACLDMLFAAKNVLTANKIKQGPLFVHGWSQGGWTNMTFLRKLESLNIPVTAAGTASAPVDGAVIVNRWMNNYQPIDAVWLPACATNFIFAKDQYNFPGLAARAIRPEYYQAAKDFYEFKIDWPTYYSKTKGKIYEVLNPEFMATGNIANDPFWKLLENMQAYRWRCKTPLVNYYGESDEVIPPYIAKLAEGFHQVLGGGSNTKAVSAGPKADHRATYIYSLIHVKPWFDSYLK